MKDTHLNVPKWIEENEKYFMPPVCNKMMHGDGQLKVFFVGGPNQRKDFHLEEGEEVFYQVNGDMNLITMERGTFKDIPIKEGEIFLLPGKIPHSPQRSANTVGLVIERERLRDNELDCLRYYIDGTTESLFEKWFYCEDLAVNLGPVIKEFFASEQYKTGKPIPGTIPENPPWTPDCKRILEAPFPLDKWITKNRSEIDEEGNKRLFDKTYETDCCIFGAGKGENGSNPIAETFLYQLEGKSEVLMEGVTTTLSEQDTLLIPKGTSFQHLRDEGSITLSVVMDSRNKSRNITACLPQKE